VNQVKGGLFMGEETKRYGESYLKNAIHILLVDDDNNFLEAAQQILESEHGFKVDKAVSVEDAYLKMAKNQYDAIVSDYEMPLKDGLTFLKEHVTSKTEIPFILFTGKGREEIAIEALNLKASGYVNKHGEPKTVYAELTHCILQGVEQKRQKRLGQILLDTLPCVALLLKSSSREIVALNKAGVAVGAVSGKTCFSSWGKRESPCPWCLAPELWATNTPQHLEVEALGVIWDAYWVPVEKDLYLHYAFDVTEKRRTEKKLQDTLDNMLEGCQIIGPDWRYLYVNDAVAKQGQYRKQELIGKTMMEAYPGIENTRLFSALKRCMDDKVPFSMENEFSFPNGEKGWFDLSIQPVPEGIFVLSQDVTEKKRMQAKLEENSKKLEHLVQERTKQLEETQLRLIKSERLAAIGELAGMVGHDLRNPLTGIKNSVYFLKKKGSDISEVHSKQMIETIEKCIERSNKIINDLLDYSKDITLEKRQTTPLALVSESIGSVQLPEKIRIENNVLNQGCLMVDFAKMERVFVNLLKNAIEAMPNGGTITIDCKQVNDSLEFSFADRGPGISKEVLPKLFMPLITTKAQGMGFGLAICRRIVEAHHGAITVETIDGVGTTFLVTIPNEIRQ
jgi:PAS domain S-box-containing protein